ncbi:MAG: hypothetical protein K0S07_1116, partial [Chlamydiales bacterium]|nr:hypothetical protein [Chlamydiales bacterium]
GWYVWRASYHNKRQKLIQTILLDFLKNRQICLKLISKQSVRVDELIPSIELIDTLIADSLWETIKLALFYDYILPKARKDTFSNSLIKRYWSAKAFSLYAQPGDMPFVKGLLQDRVLNIQTLAISTAIRFGDRQMIESAVSALAQEPLFRRCKLYSLIQHQLTPFLNHLLLQVLKESFDEKVQAVCLHLLYQQESKELTEEVILSLRNPDKDLRLLASKKLVRDLKQEAIPYLLPLLKDPVDEVRYTLLKRLWKLGWKQSLANLKAHYPDSNVWISQLYLQILKSESIDSDDVLSEEEEPSLPPKNRLLADSTL